MFQQDSRIFPLFFFYIFLMGGCETKTEPTPQKNLLEIPPPLQVAICDLDEIARELGLIDELNRILSRERTLLDNEIRKIQATRQTELNEKIEAFGEFPDDEQKRELALMQAQARQILLQAQNRASRRFAAIQENLIQQIRTKIKKPVDQVATKKGIHVVFTDRDESVLYTASVANITPEVLSAARNANLGKLEEPSGDSAGNRNQQSTEQMGTEIEKARISK